MLRRDRTPSHRRARHLAAVGKELPTELAVFIRARRMVIPQSSRYTEVKAKRLCDVSRPSPLHSGNFLYSLPGHLARAFFALHVRRFAYTVVRAARRSALRALLLCGSKEFPLGPGDIARAISLRRRAGGKEAAADAAAAPAG